MPRSRSPDRDRAYEIFAAANGKITNREIAHQLGIPEKTVGGWKAKDAWVSKLNGVLQKNEWSTPKRPGAPKGNKNAVGNVGGPGGPVGNSRAVTHGFFRRIFPDDDETLAIVDDIVSMEPIDMLWQNIVIQYAAIARAQRIMFVDDQEDHTRVLKRKKDSDLSQEREWEFQFSWDKHANYLSAQSRAMSELRSSIRTFLELADESDIRRLKLQQMQKDIVLKDIEISRLKGDGEVYEDDGFMDALKGEASKVWSDADSDET